MREESKTSADLLALTTQIVSAHISKNSISANDLQKLIEQVHASLAALGTGRSVARGEPAVPISKSIKKDYIVCLEDGTEHKMLKRHLMSAFGLTPEQYRERWGLPADYPMVAPNYSKVRSALAKKVGLGTKRMRARVARGKD
ncbi:MAG TPA: MucR family transcriptional regulator [Vineibacter sp.]|nr:MucR family transcriptional regulator [Vineibacter sp.]